MPQRVRFGRGRAAVWADMPTAQEIEAQVRDLLGPAMELAENEIREIHRDLMDKWPVKTGASRDSWYEALTLEPEKHKLSISLLSNNDYTIYIKSTSVGTNKDAVRVRSPYQAHVAAPIRAKAKELAADGRLRALLVRHLQEGLSRG